MSINKQILFWLLVLSAALCIFELTGIDIKLQDYFYCRDSGRWAVDKNDQILRLAFYTGPKAVIILFGILCFAGWILSYKAERFAGYRRFCMLMSLSLAIAPLTISSIKNVSNVYTPSQIQRYGGSKPYVKVFESYPKDFKQESRGKGWPAGHASGGFALMMLYHAFVQKKLKFSGLLAGLAVGWIMGLYQMLKGAHYLSHTVVTMFLAWILILLIYKFAQSRLPQQPAQQNFVGKTPHKQ